MFMMVTVNSKGNSEKKMSHTLSLEPERVFEYYTISYRVTL